MPRLSTPVALLITAVLAALLIFYVFSGGDSGADEGSRSRSAAQCASQQIHEQIKRELFRRAAVVRGGNDPAFAQVGAYSVVRATAPAARQETGRSGANCTAAIVLDLPPGVEVIGGRRSLAAKVEYQVVASAQGQGRLSELGNADPIVLPLATIGQTGRETPELPAPPPAVVPPAPPRPTSDNSAGREPRQTEETASRGEPGRTRASPPERRPTAAAPPPRRTTTAAAPPSRSATPTSRTAPSRTAAAPVASPAPVATVRPSFDCRRARTRGEIAVCSDPSLASLDRQMSSQFYRALSNASPGARLMLQRTRARFLKYRDSCGSAACVAEAYSARMREISDITSGRY